MAKNENENENENKSTKMHKLRCNDCNSILYKQKYKTTETYKCKICGKNNIEKTDEITWKYNIF